MIRRQFAYLTLTMVMAGTLAVGQQPPAATARQAPLTDRDVIQMVQSGKAEAAIAATIRSSRTDFDLSFQGCKLLVAAHVSRTILNAMGGPSGPPCASTSSSTPKASGTGTLLGNGNATLLGDGSKQTQPAVAASSSGGDRVALNPQPLPPRTAANSSSSSPGASAAQAGAAVSDYRQPPGNKVPSGLKATVLEGRVLLPPGSRPAGPQHPPAGSVSVKTTAPAGMVKAQPQGAAPLGPGQTLSAQNPSTSPANSAKSIAPATTNVRPAMAATAHYPGIVEGYVYWDANWSGAYCGFVSITVSVAQKPNVYAPLGTLGNISEYVGTVAYSEPDVVGSVTVCKYIYPNVPIGQDLQVHIDLGPFSWAVRPSNPTVGPINIPKISSMKCRMSPPNAALAQPPLSQKDLNSNWEICGDSAYKVNFMTSPIVWI